eukprot:TRINITY_DN4679_c0_g2_i3.p1 TRINITY_DN4679_c0_g2~~TRINITY_DN4679_c0_g2_i3.p1  ORF type:complete len:1273 (-),score=289.15 TRINITY_DN4679_c0_g2_i3:387-4205(-)
MEQLLRIGAAFATVTVVLAVQSSPVTLPAAGGRHRRQHRVSEFIGGDGAFFVQEAPGALERLAASRAGLSAGSAVESSAFVEAGSSLKLSAAAQAELSASGKKANASSSGPDVCQQYDGIRHPDALHCCHGDCGLFCGAEDCAGGPGGAAACCADAMSEVTRCGETRLHTAPCRLDVKTLKVGGMCLAVNGASAVLEECRGSQPSQLFFFDDDVPGSPVVWNGLCLAVTSGVTASFNWGDCANPLKPEQRFEIGSVDIRAGADENLCLASAGPSLLALSPCVHQRPTTTTTTTTTPACMLAVKANPGDTILTLTRLDPEWAVGNNIRIRSGSQQEIHTITAINESVPAVTIADAIRHEQVAGRALVAFTATSLLPTIKDLQQTLREHKEELVHEETSKASNRDMLKGMYKGIEAAKKLLAHRFQTTDEQTAETNRFATENTQMLTQVQGDLRKVTAKFRDQLTSQFLARMAQQEGDVEQMISELDAAQQKQLKALDEAHLMLRDELLDKTYKSLVGMWRDMSDGGRLIASKFDRDQSFIEHSFAEVKQTAHDAQEATSNVAALAERTADHHAAAIEAVDSMASVFAAAATAFDRALDVGSNASATRDSSLLQSVEAGQEGFERTLANIMANTGQKISELDRLVTISDEAARSENARRLNETQAAIELKVRQLMHRSSEHSRSAVEAISEQSAAGEQRVARLEEGLASTREAVRGQVMSYVDQSLARLDRRLLNAETDIMRFKERTENALVVLEDRIRSYTNVTSSMIKQRVDAIDSLMADAIQVYADNFTDRVLEAMENVAAAVDYKYESFRQETQASRQAVRKVLPAVYNGDIVFLESLSFKWLSCSERQCSASSLCAVEPAARQEQPANGYDHYQDCLQERFRIFNSQGFGEVRNGDIIYLRSVDAKFLACGGNETCRVNSNCPVHFEQRNSSDGCPEERFRIFNAFDAGDITHGDIVWLQLDGQESRWLTCTREACRADGACPDDARNRNEERNQGCDQEKLRIYTSHVIPTILPSTPTPMPPAQEVGKCETTADAFVGDTTLQVTATFGFHVGDLVRLEGDGLNAILAFAPLTLRTPLSHAVSAGARVQLLRACDDSAARSVGRGGEFCEDGEDVSGSPGVESLAACQEYVLRECRSNRLFNWRGSDGVCQCAVEGCPTRGDEVNGTVYSSCLAPACDGFQCPDGMTLKEAMQHAYCEAPEACEATECCAMMETAAPATTLPPLIAPADATTTPTRPQGDADVAEQLQHLPPNLRKILQQALQAQSQQ